MALHAALNPITLGDRVLNSFLHRFEVDVSPCIAVVLFARVFLRMPAVMLAAVALDEPLLEIVRNSPWWAKGLLLYSLVGPFVELILGVSLWRHHVLAFRFVILATWAALIVFSMMCVLTPFWPAARIQGVGFM